MEGYKVIDATGLILGRMAGTVAKQLLKGDNVIVVNAEKAIISGHKNDIVEKYRTRLNLQEKGNPEHSPYWSRRSDLLVKRVVRGMLPYSRATGRKVYKNLKVYMGLPEEFKGNEIEKIAMKDPKSLYSGYITIKELSELLGYNKG
ncbi:50S ribosomal protein L13p [Candidatus Mancarchaeum acidiphilum]|uniref:Large ribosomal subunit protein uL13 n=1 Tax=Candidatus Mancarchaeum acidiphilum TaxID=1920749 RepID=A0A218NLP4_9ARCH|nr:50S ribosomal protein L13 [Candidatus Mancarchaeum acidiphilum]ASI13362.1 50S ribosomal protein L13p [Candidatus Mancarchaeum acidiphilum]